VAVEVEEEEHDGATKSAAAATVPAADGGEAAADVEAVAGVSAVAPSCFRLPFLAVVFVSFAGAIPAPPHLLVLTYVEHASAESSRRRLRVLPWVRAPLPPRPLGSAGLVVGLAALALLRLPRRLHLPRPPLQPRLHARLG
jgi:hypothetical protein